MNINARLIIGIFAALSWAPLEALVHLARPVPPLQVAALALFGAFIVVRLVTYMQGVCAVRPWQSPAAVLGLGALAAWGLQLTSGHSVWAAPNSAWFAIAAITLGPLSLTAWAWQTGAKAWVLALAAGALLLGGRLI
ncbi:MAG: hypothetical protein NUV50_10885 [Rhodospirillales bacterium]|nr:hypothetical protein [Rhodospirillales bacterium]